MLHHFVCWYVKCVGKVPFNKSGYVNSTILKNIQYTSLCTFKSIAFPLWRNEVICYKNARWKSMTNKADEPINQYVQKSEDVKKIIYRRLHKYDG